LPAYFSAVKTALKVALMSLTKMWLESEESATVIPAATSLSPGSNTDRKCDQLLWNDLKPVKQAVDSMVKVPLSEYPRAALYSFTYDVGVSAFSKSTLLKMLNNGD